MVWSKQNQELWHVADTAVNALANVEVLTTEELEQIRDILQKAVDRYDRTGSVR